MGLLDFIRTPRIGPGPLGNGAWRRVHDRFARAVHRFRAVIDVVPSRPVRVELLAGPHRILAFVTREAVDAATAAPEMVASYAKE